MKCQEPITFDDNHISDSGKKIPLEWYGSEPHVCDPNILRKKTTLRCKYCDKKIYFDPDITSKYGTPVPVSAVAERPFNRETRRQWWQEQQSKARQERERKEEEERQRHQETEFRRRFYDEWQRERDGRELYNKEQQRKLSEEEQRQRKTEEEYRRTVEEERRKRYEEEYRRRQRQEQDKIMKDNVYYCRILGITLSATRKEIIEAWRRLCLKFHPDRCLREGIEESYATEMMKKINEAYENVLIGVK